jgi:hypothetical protein
VTQNHVTLRNAKVDALIPFSTSLPQELTFISPLSRASTSTRFRHNDEMSLSLPGLGLDEPEEAQAVETVQHDLAKETEWRFEAAVGKYIHLKVFFHFNCRFLFRRHY